MAGWPRIVSDSSYDGAAQLREQQPAKRWTDSDFGWSENAVYAWRGVALFGGLLVLEGLLSWLWAAYYGGLPGTLLLALVLFGVASAVAALWSYTEAALALLGAMVVAAVLVFVARPSTFPGLGAVFSDWSAFTSDLATFVGLWVAGGILLGIGAFRAVKLNSRIPVDP